MKERPILFSAPMVRRLLDGSKSQTRRVVNPQPEFDPEYRIGDSLRGANGRPYLCRYGHPGDRLWVRETCRARELSDEEARRRDPKNPPYGLDGIVYPADQAFITIANTPTAAERWCVLNGYRNKKSAIVPAIHMPRWACRIVLEVTNVRIERVQAISEGDAQAEGARFHDGLGVGHTGWRHDDGFVFDSARTSFAALWMELNGKDSWKANPWVWVVEFRRVFP